MPSVGFSQIYNDGQVVNVIGIKLYYADGTSVSIPMPLPPLSPPKVKQTKDAWLAAPSVGVQCVNIYFDREYDFHIGGGVLARKRYKKTLTQDELYWLSPTEGFGSGTVGPADALVKTGSIINLDDKPSYYAVYNVAFEDRVF